MLFESSLWLAFLTAEGAESAKDFSDENFLMKP